MTKWEWIALGSLLWVLISINIAAYQQQNIIPMDPVQQLTMENIMLRQENLRLRICLSKHVTEAECGNLQMNGVVHVDIKKNESSTGSNQER